MSTRDNDDRRRSNRDFDWDTDSRDRDRRRDSRDYRDSRDRRPSSDSRSSHSRDSRDYRDSRDSRSRDARSSRSYDDRRDRDRRDTRDVRRQPSKKRKKRKTALLVVEIMVVVLLVGVVALWMKFGRTTFDNTIQLSDIEVNELSQETEEILDSYTTIALFGVDNRSNGDYDGGNSDSMMVVSINNTTKEVNMVSVMRDTYMEVSDDTYRKCNYAYNHGGAEQALEMLNKNLDLKVSGYVSVDFYALAAIVDDLGGIEVEITQSMVDAVNPETGGPALAGYIAEVQTVIGEVDEDKWWLSAGTQTLDGAQIVGYCRNRYSGGDDYGRTERQREVVKKIIEKVKASDVATITKVVTDIMPYVSTSLSPAQVLDMAKDAGSYSIVATSGFPFALTTGTYGSKGSLVVPCTLEDNVVALHKYLYAQEDYQPTETVSTISSKIQSDTGTSSSSATTTQTDDQ